MPSPSNSIFTRHPDRLTRIATPAWQTATYWVNYAPLVKFIISCESLDVLGNQRLAHRRNHLDVILLPQTGQAQQKSELHSIGRFLFPRETDATMIIAKVPIPSFSGIAL